MSLQARKHDYGDFSFYESCDKTQIDYLRNGTTTTTVTHRTYEQHSCGRAGHTNNPAQTVQGVPNYRMPAGYSRYIYNVTPETGEFVWVNPNPGSSPTSIMKTVITLTPQVGAINNSSWPTGWATPTPNGQGGWSAVEARAVNAVLLRLNDEKLNVAQDMAEAMKSFDMFCDLSVTLMRALIAVKHGHFMQAYRWLGLNSARGITRRYLEYIYGWKPLMTDIYGAGQLLGQKLNNSSGIVKANRRITQSFVADASGKSSDGIKGTAYCSIGLVAKISNQYSRAANQMGLTDPGELAWELVPWSFVVDWILPVGDFIRAMHAHTGLTFVSGYKTDKVETRGLYYENPPSGYTVSTPAAVRTEGFAMRRTTYADFPKPVLSIQSPFRSSNARNALALAAQLLKLRW